MDISLYGASPVAQQVKLLSAVLVQVVSSASNPAPWKIVLELSFQISFSSYLSIKSPHTSNFWGGQKSFTLPLILRLDFFFKDIYFSISKICLTTLQIFKNS